MKKLAGVVWIVLIVGTVQAGVIYSNDFNGVAGTEGSASIPTTTIKGFTQNSAGTNLDGKGSLQAYKSGTGWNYRFYMDDKAEKNLSFKTVKYTAVVKTPTVNWLGIGFLASNKNGMTAPSANAGPWAMINSDGSIIVYGGYGTNGSAYTFMRTHKPGDDITVEMAYSPDTRTVNFTVNGITLANDMAVTHIDETSLQEGHSALKVFQVTFHKQNLEVNGGAAVKCLVLETVPAPITVGMTDASAVQELFSCVNKGARFVL